MQCAFRQAYPCASTILLRVVLAAVLLNTGRTSTIHNGDRAATIWGSWLRRNGDGEGPLRKGAPTTNANGTAWHCQAHALEVDTPKDTVEQLLKGVSGFIDIMVKLNDLRGHHEVEPINRCAILVTGDEGMKFLVRRLYHYVNTTSVVARNIEDHPDAPETANDARRLVARILLFYLKPVMWLAACEDSQHLLRIVLLLFHTLGLEQERLCIVRWSLVVLDELVARQPKKEPERHLARFRGELLMMDEPTWNPDDVDKMLKVLPKVGRSPRKWQTDGTRMRLRKFVTTFNSSRIGRWERNQVMDRLKNNIDLGELKPALKLTEVPRIRAENLSFADFYHRFAVGRKPVVIEGMDLGWQTQKAWYEVQELCGDLPIEKIKRMEPGSLEPANIVAAKTNPTNLEAWMDFVMFDVDFLTGPGQEDWMGDGTDAESDADPKMAGLMVYQEPLLERNTSEEICPKLMQRLTVPRYFAGDFLKRSPWYRESKMRHRDLLWDSPSISVMPGNTSMGWRHTRLGAHSWHLLLYGRQIWRFAPVANKRDRALWFCEHPAPRYDFVLPNREEDARLRDWQRINWHSSVYPENVEVRCPPWAAGSSKGIFKIVEVELQAGDVMFVPSGMPYEVKNLQRTLILSSSYVDASNVEDFLSEAAAEKTVELARRHKKTPFSLKKKSRDMRKDLFGNELPAMLREPRDLSWSDYARGPRPWEANLTDAELLFADQAACDATASYS